MIIKEITSSEKEMYCSFFKKGLDSDPSNFRIHVNDPEVFPTKDRADSFTLGAFDDRDLIGVVSFHRDGENRIKLQHKGWLIRMLVGQSQRGKGVGTSLITSLIDRVRSLGTIEQINLTVVSEDARQLYSRLGFEVFAEEKNAVKSDGMYLTEYQMVLFL